MVRNIELEYDVEDIRRRYFGLSTGQVYDAFSESGLKGRSQIEASLDPLHVQEKTGRF